MATVLIAYDLHKLGQRYSDLRERIKANFPTHWACLESTFIVETDRTAAQVRDVCSPALDGNDELLVIALASSGWATHGMSAQCNDWLRSHVSGS